MGPISLGVRALIAEAAVPRSRAGADLTFQKEKSGAVRQEWPNGEPLRFGRGLAFGLAVAVAFWALAAVILLRRAS